MKENKKKENERKGWIIYVLFGWIENRWKENREKIFFCLDEKKVKKNHNNIKLH